MKSSNGILAGQQAKRPAPATRVVPALPLTMTKAKPAKPVARPSTQEKTTDKVEEKSNGAAQVNGNGAIAELAGHDVVGVNGLENNVKRGNTQTPISQASASASISEAPTPSNVLSAASAEAPPASTRLSGDGSNNTAGAATARKPTDRFDMRAIKTEMPPPFVPNSHTPQSSVSSNLLPNPSGAPGLHANIVFGGREDSSNSSPAPPQSADSSAFAPPPFPQPAPYSHQHHFSEPQASRHNPAYPLSPMHWSQRPGFNPQPSYQGPNGHLRYPPREAFHPQAGHPGSGYRNRTGSYVSGSDLQSPTALGNHGDGAFGDMKGGFPGHRHHFSHVQQGPPPPNGFQPGAYFDNSDPLRAYLLSQFQDGAFSDSVIEFVDESDALTTIDAHRLILARSLKLRDLIKVSKEDGSKLKIRIHAPTIHLRFGSFVDSIRFLYGAPAPMIDPYGPIPPTERVTAALELVAAGSFLKLDVIAHRAVQAVFGYLRWESVPAVLALALDGGLSSVWDDGSEAASDSSSDAATRSEIGNPTYEPYATEILHRFIDFAVQTIPPEFYIDGAAPQLVASPRLPTHSGSHERSNSRINPRLSQIRFGEMGGDDLQRPPFEATVISSVLLSLPFPLLKALLESPPLMFRLGSDTHASVTRQVIHEREQRRLKALKAYTANNAANGVSGTLVANLYWEESAEHSDHHPTGCRITRKRVGVDTPPSSAAEV